MPIDAAVAHTHGMAAAWMSLASVGKTERPGVRSISSCRRSAPQGLLRFPVPIIIIRIGHNPCR